MKKIIALRCKANAIEEEKFSNEQIWKLESTREKFRAYIVNNVRAKINYYLHFADETNDS